MSPRKSKKEKTEKNMSNVQKQVCADILRTSDVLKSQIMSQLIENLGSKVEREELASIKRQVENTITKQSSSLVDRVIKATSEN